MAADNYHRPEIPPLFAQQLPCLKSYLLHDFHAITQHLQHYPLSQSERCSTILDNQTVTFEDFLWATASVMSRAFVSTEGRCLIPTIDLLNHADCETSNMENGVHFNSSGGIHSMQMVATSNIPTGQELTFSYHSCGSPEYIHKSNGTSYEFFLAYGFFLRRANSDEMLPSLGDQSILSVNRKGEECLDLQYKGALARFMALPTCNAVPTDLADSYSDLR